MPVVTSALRLLGFALGTGLYLFLSVLVGRKRLWRLFAFTASAGLWHAFNLSALFYRIVSANDAGLLPVAAEHAAKAAFYITPIAAAVLLVTKTEKRLYRWLAVSFLLVLAGLAAGTGSGLFVSATLAPALALFYFIYRYNVHGLLIGRRFLFTITLAAVSALYLLAAKLISDTAAHSFDAFGSVLEVAVILAAAVVWLPLYEWMTRAQARRTELYTDFSKRVIDEAVRILDLGERAQFLVDGVGRTFHLRRALLAVFGDPPLERSFGEQRPDGAVTLAPLQELAGRHGGDVIHVERSHDTALEKSGFPYLFPLRYENRLTGLLLVDPWPHIFLDENEPVLTGLCRQISHSIEACRLIDQKIALEKTLLAQEHLAALGNVAATIAHEVKNPLSSIRALSQFMKEDEDVNERFGADLQHIIDETDRLASSVRQLLTYARPAPEAAGPVELSELLETLSRTLAREYAGRRIGIEPAIEPALRLTRADHQSVQQIVLNLVLNAIQASPPDSTVRLEACRKADGRVAIAVTDSGPGIPAELREKIFQPYFTTKQKGTGLGLSIVRKNVRALGGELQLESPVADNRGTRIRVLLPLQ